MNCYEEVIKQWQSKQIDTTDKLESALKNFKVLFAYHSGVIENAQITYEHTREIFQNRRLVNFTGDIKTVLEIENQRKCYDFLEKRIVAKEMITPELIKQIHRELTDGTYDEYKLNQGEHPGEYKVHDYMIADNQGALPEEVSEEVEELCEELQNIQDKGSNILKAAAYLHCKFENIHPFADGNGRVGRTLTNYFLMIHDFPPFIAYYDTRKYYYNALAVYDKTGEIDKFWEYIKSNIERTWEISEPVDCQKNK